MEQTNSTPEPKSGSPRPETEARFFRFAVGDVECIAVSDGSIRVPQPGGPPQPSSNRSAQLQPAAGGPEFRFVPLSCLVLRMPAAGKLILMDSGFGFEPARVGEPMRTDGRLVESLAGAGITPEQIDIVLISHLDPDHVGGLYTNSGAKVFANAEYYAPEEAVSFWSREAIDLSGSPCPPPIKQGRVNAARRLMEAAGAGMKTFRAGETIVPGLDAISLPGHAPGQVGFVVSSGGETLLYTADAVAHAEVSVETPAVHNPMDLDPHLGAETRQTLIDRLASSGWQSFSPHFPWPSVGRVERSADGGTKWKSRSQDQS